MNKSGKFIFLFIAVLIGSILLVLYCVFFEEILKSDNFVISLWQNKQIDIGNFNSEKSKTFYNPKNFKVKDKSLKYPAKRMAQNISYYKSNVLRKFVYF